MHQKGKELTSLLHNADIKFADVIVKSGVRTYKQSNAIIK